MSSFQIYKSLHPMPNNQAMSTIICAILIIDFRSFPMVIHGLPGIAKLKEVIRRMEHKHGWERMTRPRCNGKITKLKVLCPYLQYSFEEYYAIMLLLVELNFDYGTGQAGFTFRTTDADQSPNFIYGKSYIFYYDNYYKYVVLKTPNYYGGLPTDNTLITIYKTEGCTPCTLRVEVEGNVIKGYFNNEFLDEVTSDFASRGSVSLVQWRAGVTFKSLRIMFPNNQNINDFLENIFQIIDLRYST